MDTSCRVCHRDDGARTIDVATWSEASQMPISLMLSYCAQVEVSNGEQICSECLMNLETAFNFRKQCRQTTRLPVISKVRGASKKPFQCCVSSCAMTSNSLRELVLHSTKRHCKERESNTAQQKTKAVSTSCPICCMGFGSVSAMKNHSETLNIHWNKFRCDKCRMVCQNMIQYAEHRIERCTGVPAKADEDDYVMEGDDEDTHGLDVKMRHAMEIVKTGKLFMIKLTESEHYILTETIYPLKGLLEELLASYNKTSKIFYICETCGYQCFVKAYILQHVATSQECQGFYNALGSSDPMLEEPWLSCATCQFLATNPISIMKHQIKHKHSGIKTVPPKSSKAVAVSNTEQCNEIGGSKVEAPQKAVKVEPVESDSFPVTQPVAKPPIKTKSNRQKLAPKQRPAVVQTQIQECRCGLTFPRNMLLQRHIKHYCPLRYQKADPVKGVRNVLQCDGCLITLVSPSDVARHQQNSCPAYQRKRVAERYRVSGADV